MGEYLLGIDIGTSACKIAVFAKDGTVKATGTGDYQVYYPHPGWQNRIRKNGGKQFAMQSQRCSQRGIFPRKRLKESGSMGRAGLQSQ